NETAVVEVAEVRRLAASPRPRGNPLPEGLEGVRPQGPLAEALNDPPGKTSTVDNVIGGSPLLLLVIAELTEEGRQHLSIVQLAEGLGERAHLDVVIGAWRGRAKQTVRHLGQEASHDFLSGTRPVLDDRGFISDDAGVIVRIELV